MRNQFDRELARLSSELMEMGALIEDAITNAVGALAPDGTASAKRAMELEEQIDETERDIERRCLRLLLQQQPVARDLRTISTALKMITDMERIGDQARDISEIALTLPRGGALEPEHIPRMAEATIHMVKGAIDAFIARDEARANEVIAYDDVVDELFSRVRDDIASLLRRERESGETAIDFLMIAKYFERIGDHAVNIAEWVVFSITGTHKSAKIV